MPRGAAVWRKRNRQTGDVNQPLWSAVDDYWTTKLHAPDDALDAAAADSAAGGLPPIAVTAPMGKFLHLLARTARALGASWRSARSAATRRSGSPARSRPTASW